MKVYIGNYPTPISVDGILHTLFFWKSEDDEFIEKLSNLVSWCQWRVDAQKPLNPTWIQRMVWWLNERRKRTSFVHVSGYDAYSADDTLAMVIVPVLKKLRGHARGAPFVDNVDVPEHLHMTEEQYQQYTKDGTPDPRFLDRWHWVVDEMIWSFEQKLIDWEDEYTSGEMDIQWKPVEGGYKQMCYGPNHTYQRDQEGIKAHQARIERGRLLFAKYYDSLWY